MSVIQRSAARLCIYAARSAAGAIGPSSLSTGLLTTAGQAATPFKPVVATAAARTALLPLTRSFASEPAPSGDDERKLGNEKVRLRVRCLPVCGVGALVVKAKTYRFHSPYRFNRHRLLENL